MERLLQPAERAHPVDDGLTAGTLVERQEREDDVAFRARHEDTGDFLLNELPFTKHRDLDGPGELLKDGVLVQAVDERIRHLMDLAEIVAIADEEVLQHVGLGIAGDL